MVYNPVYKIVEGGAGGFLCPPGHPHHTHHLEGKESPRHRNVMFSGALGYALSDKFDGSDYTKDRVRAMMDAATLVESEMWIRSVYDYFRNSYAPEDGTRDASKAITHNPADIAAGAARKALAETFEIPGKLYTTEIRPLPWIEEDGQGEADPNSYRDGSAKTMRGARRGYEVTAKADGTRVYVYALADDGTRYGALPILQHYADVLTEAGFANVEIQEPQDRPTSFVPERVTADNPVLIERIDPARHLAVMCIREYFPDHTPRLDLIENPGKGYDAWPCTKCGEKVQYEAKFDKLTRVSTRMDGSGMTHWTYETECPKGGDHAL